MNQAERFALALRTLRMKGWCQHVATDAEGRVCAAQAFCANVYVEPRAFSRDCELFSNTMSELFPSLFENRFGIVGINDHLHTSWPMVEQGLEKCIVKAQEMEAI